MIRAVLAARVLIPGLTGLVLGCLPGAGLLLWNGQHAPTVLHSTEAMAHSRAIPAASSAKPSLWEIPNG